MNDQKLPTVLIVEDVEMNRDLLIQLLEDDYRVVTAADGEEGVAAARRELPDIILMDLSLPVMDGWEAMRTIRASADISHLRIIAVTAHAMPEDEHLARSAGADDYMTKPIDEEVLFQKLADNLVSES
jgi:two-component system cell cycle response regulator DivK